VSSLTLSDLATVASLVDFHRGAGYVLDFSDRTFSQFFATELGLDIDEPRYADLGTSKGKRLRRFLQLVDDRTAAAALIALWNVRLELLSLLGGADPVANAQGKHEALLAKLTSGGVAKPPQPPVPPPDQQHRLRLQDALTALAQLQAQPRGYAFEKFLSSLFQMHGLHPREPFRNRGEQIDGSFIADGNTYLLEAKWQSEKVGVADLHSFEGKLGEKAIWARGLFVSYMGFSDDGLHAFGRGKRTLCMDGYDLFEMLNRNLTLGAVLDAKARRAAETGSPFVRVRDLF
jgi:hypothetical protein